MLVQTSLMSPNFGNTVTEYRFRINSTKPRHSTHAQLEKALLHETQLDDLDEYTFYSVERSSFPPKNFNVIFEWSIFIQSSSI